MPSIEITAEQAAALARGENITVSAPDPERRYVVTFLSGNTFLFKTAAWVRTGAYNGHIFSGRDGVLIDKGPHTEPLGYRQPVFSSACKSVIRLDD